MVHELKFRAWDTNDKCWWTNFIVTKNGEPASVHEENGERTGYYFAPLDGLIVEQFTGLKDKNGAEIYENDIVKMRGVCSDVYGTITFSRGEFWVNSQTPNEFYTCEGPRFTWEEVEVIGNIHENKEEAKL